MKSFSTLFIAATVVLSSTTVAFADLPPENWEIQNFHSEIYLTNDYSVNVTETIVADFTNEAHRGIGRVIPEADSPIQFISSVNEQGIEWVNTISRYSGQIDMESLNHELEYRNDINTYIMSYLVKFGFKYFDTHDEFHWNVNGTQWPVKVRSVSATVHLPENLNPREIDVTCHTGVYQSTAQDCTYEIFSDTVEFKSTYPLDRYENLSIVIGMPVGTVLSPPLQARATSFFKNLWGFGVALLAAILMPLLWFFKGRDDHTEKTTIIPHYHPPEDLLPTEVGTLMDESMDSEDITALIVDYAIKGVIQIHETEKKNLLFGKTKDYELELKKHYKTTKEFEKIILDGIFPINEPGVKVSLTTLTSTFGKEIPKVQKSIMKQLIKDGFFPHNPATIRKLYAGTGGTIVIISFQLAVVVGIANAIGIGIAGVIMVLFGNVLPRKTKKGTETYYKLKGLYEYIKTAEKDRIEFQENASIFFERLLPYAISLGLAKRWSGVFKDILKAPPTWLTSYDPNFSMLHFTHSLNKFESSFTNQVATPPSSKSSGFGGGGFSGGGGGGGGGGGR